MVIYFINLDIIYPQNMGYYTFINYNSEKMPSNYQDIIKLRIMSYYIHSDCNFHITIYSHGPKLGHIKK